MTRGGVYNEIEPDPEGNPEGEARVISRGLRLYFFVFPDLSQNTEILNFNSNIGLSGRSIMEELILHIARTAGQYGKVSPSRLNNTREVYFNIEILSFQEWSH